MAASVRIEDEAFSDRRYDVLARLLNLPDADCARGKMAAVWRQCTQQQKHILGIEIVRTILGNDGPDAIIKSDLGEQVDAGIRIRGTKGRIEWLKELRKSAKKGGLRRASQASRMAGKFSAKRLVSDQPPAGEAGQAKSSAPALILSPALSPTPSPAPFPPSENLIAELTRDFLLDYRGPQLTRERLHTDCKNAFAEALETFPVEKIRLKIRSRTKTMFVHEMVKELTRECKPSLREQIIANGAEFIARGEK